jgi:hypothetical protein
MVQILDREPSFGELFSKQLGAGLTSGLQQGMNLYSQVQKQKFKDQLALQKKIGKIRPEVKSFLSLYDKNKAFDPQMIEALETGAHNYLEQGLEPSEAVKVAYNDILSSAKTSQEKEPGFAEKHGFKRTPGLAEKLGIVSPEGLGEDIKTGIKKGIRPLVGVADFPLQLAKRGNYLGRGNFKSLLDYYDEATEGKGAPTNAVERIAQGYPLGVAGLAGEYAVEAAESAGLPESVQEAAGIVTMILAHRAKFPALKEVFSKSEKVASKTGQPQEKVLQEAAVKSGADLEKAAAGDASEAAKIKSVLTDTEKSIASKVESVDKKVFDVKQAAKEREVFGAKLPESPLEEYQNIRARELGKEASKRPETLARERETRERLAPEESRLYNELRGQREELVRMEQALRKSSGEATDRIGVLRDYQVKKLNETTERLKDIQYEMKYGRPRPSEAEISAQIQKSIKEFEDGILNPTEKTEKAVARQLELDKEYLDRAKKLIERGELPGEIRPDTFIKMKQKYLDGYKAAMKKARDEISQLKGEADVASKRKIETNRELINRLGNRIKRLEADIVNQTDNIKAMRALERPSGAFYKTQINSLRKDNALFKGDLFKQIKVKGKEEFKTHQVAQKRLKDSNAGKKVAESPTKENIQEATKETGKPESKLMEAWKTTKEEIKAIDEKVKSGTVNPNTENKLLKRLKRVAVYTGGGFVAGLVEGLMEEVFKANLDAGTWRALAMVVGVGTAGTATKGRKLVHNIFDKIQAKELVKHQGNPSEWNKYVANMQKEYGSAKAKRVVNMAEGLRSKRD